MDEDAVHYFWIELWNVRDRIEQVLARTNNSVEGWHRGIDIRITTGVQ